MWQYQVQRPTLTTVTGEVRVTPSSDALFPKQINTFSGVLNTFMYKVKKNTVSSESTALIIRNYRLSLSSSLHDIFKKIKKIYINIFAFCMSFEPLTKQEHKYLIAQLQI